MKWIKICIFELPRRVKNRRTSGWQPWKHFFMHLKYMKGGSFSHLLSSILVTPGSLLLLSTCNRRRRQAPEPAMHLPKYTSQAGEYFFWTRLEKTGWIANKNSHRSKSRNFSCFMILYLSAALHTLSMATNVLRSSMQRMSEATPHIPGVSRRRERPVAAAAAPVEEEEELAFRDMMLLFFLCCKTFNTLMHVDSVARIQCNSKNAHFLPVHVARVLTSLEKQLFVILRKQLTIRSCPINLRSKDKERRRSLFGGSRS